MSPKSVIDTNLYIDWMNDGLRADLIEGDGKLRYLSSIVLMELRVGATTHGKKHKVDQLASRHIATKRVIVPSVTVCNEAGCTLQKLRRSGWEIDTSSLRFDVLIALSARSRGATVYTRDKADYTAIHRVLDFELVIV